MSERKLFTSESVSEGHPDKIADQISDAILDAILAEDPDAHVAAETAVYTGSVHVFGEVSTTAYVDINRVVRDTIAEIGYNNAEYGFAAESVGVHPSLIEQSPDIAQGVNEALEVRGTGDQDPLDLIGAGDQGLMFGFAIDETPEFMPLPVSLSHKLVKKLADLRKSGEISYLRPDAKSQVTVEYDEKKLVKYPYNLLDELELAYAITIHKSQGSEYPAVILPILSGPRMLMNRNLLYTAVTRARKCVTVVGSETTFAEMIRNEKQQQRYSSLDQRICEMEE